MADMNPLDFYPISENAKIAGSNYTASMHNNNNQEKKEEMIEIQGVIDLSDEILIFDDVHPSVKETEEQNGKTYKMLHCRVPISVHNMMSVVSSNTRKTKQAIMLEALEKYLSGNR